MFLQLNHQKLEVYKTSRNLLQIVIVSHKVFRQKKNLILFNK